jgi:hypothetical protein
MITTKRTARQSRNRITNRRGNFYHEGHEDHEGKRKIMTLFPSFVCFVLFVVIFTPDLTKSVRRPTKRRFTAETPRSQSSEKVSSKRNRKLFSAYSAPLRCIFRNFAQIARIYRHSSTKVREENVKAFRTSCPSCAPRKWGGFITFLNVILRQRRRICFISESQSRSFASAQDDNHVGVFIHWRRA